MFTTDETGIIKSWKHN